MDSDNKEEICWGMSENERTSMTPCFHSLFKMPCFRYATGWWYTYPSEKYESQLGLLFPIYGKIKNVPNHQLGY